MNTKPERFGSHICPDAVLGGYWRIDAKYSSLETKELHPGFRVYRLIGFRIPVGCEYTTKNNVVL